MHFHLPLYPHIGFWLTFTSMIHWQNAAFDPTLALSNEARQQLHVLRDADKDSIFRLANQFEKQQAQPLIHQWMARQKMKEKLPFLCALDNTLFPPLVNLEQCSSEATARYKASLCHGHTFVDLSAGLGVDAYFMAQKFTQGLLIEPDKTLVNIAAHNFFCLQQHNVQWAAGSTASSFLEHWEGPCDLLYIDPSRRTASKGRVVLLSDCEPNIPALLPTLFMHSERIMLKTAPLLDIQQALQQLSGVKEVHIVAWQQECKELLFVLEKGFEGEVEIIAAEVANKEPVLFRYFLPEEKLATPSYSEPATYLYEPAPALMKAGCFRLLCSTYGITKLEVNSHLYTSTEKVASFPGRSFVIIDNIPVDKKQLQACLPKRQANLTLRNFPGSAADLQKKLGLKDGGEYYVFATTTPNHKKRLLICRKA